MWTHKDESDTRPFLGHIQVGHGELRGQGCLCRYGQLVRSFRVEEVVAGSDRQTTPGEDAPKRLPWVHVAIANAKSLFRDMYHGIKEKFLQYYLDEFCYEFNRMYFGDRMFDRIVLAEASYRPSFKHRTYGSE